MTERLRRRLERAFAVFGLDAARALRLPAASRPRTVRRRHRPMRRRARQHRLVGRQLDPRRPRRTTRPIVTMAGPLMRGRHTMAILQRMGVTDTIAETVDDYVAIAARLGRDPPWRMAARQQISENKHRVYRDSEAIAALEDFFCRVARGDDRAHRRKSRPPRFAASSSRGCGPAHIATPCGGPPQQRRRQRRAAGGDSADRNRFIPEIPMTAYPTASAPQRTFPMSCVSELLFVDPGVIDRSTILENLRPGVEAIVLDIDSSRGASDCCCARRPPQPRRSARDRPRRSGPGEFFRRRLVGSDARGRS